MKNVTIYDLAKEAGVSPATVSRILTGSTNVSEEKRQKVRQLIEKYDFVPNAMARGLTVSSSRTIGILVPDAMNPYYSTVFSYCCNEAYARGYSMMLLNTFSDTVRENEGFAKLIEQRVDAVIVCGGRVDLAEMSREVEEGMKVSDPRCRVVIASYSEFPFTAGICIDHRQCMDLAVDHLMALGHREIGFVFAGTQYIGTKWKLERLREKLDALGLPFRDEWMIECDTYRLGGGKDAAARLAALSHRPTAVIALNDVLAAGVLRGFREAQINVPGDISVISFDNSSIATLLTPELTSVGYDYELFGKMLVDYAVGEHAGKNGVNVMIPGTLVVRESTACPGRN